MARPGRVKVKSSAPTCWRCRKGGDRLARIALRSKDISWFSRMARNCTSVRSALYPCMRAGEWSPKDGEKPPAARQKSIREKAMLKRAQPYTSNDPGRHIPSSLWRRASRHNTPTGVAGHIPRIKANKTCLKMKRNFRTVYVPAAPSRRSTGLTTTAPTRQPGGRRNCQGVNNNDVVLQWTNDYDSACENHHRRRPATGDISEGCAPIL